MHRSRLALAGAETTLQAWARREVPPTENDGIVTAEEAGGLKLDGTWLVVLSACETGSGQARAGEGVMGLRRGFIHAGVRRVCGRSLEPMGHRSYNRGGWVVGAGVVTPKPLLKKGAFLMRDILISVEASRHRCKRLLAERKVVLPPLKMHDHDEAVFFHSFRIEP